MRPTELLAVALIAALIVLVVLEATGHEWAF